MIKIELDNVDPRAFEQSSEIIEYKPTPAGKYAMRIYSLSLSKQDGETNFETGESTGPVYTLKAFLVHEDKSLRLNGVNYKVDVAGKKNITTKAGESMTISLEGNLVRFLANLGVSEDVIRQGGISLTATDEEISAAGWKGAPTGIMIGSVDITDSLKEVVVDAQVKQGKKSPYVAAIAPRS